MGLWHIGGVVFLFRWIFRDPKVDLRFLALGAVLPMVADGLWGLAPAVVAGTKLAGHSLVTAVLLMSVIMIITKRGPDRKPWMALSVGVLFHLLLDGMWAEQQSFLWPLFGWSFATPHEGASNLLISILDSPWRAVQEVVGLGYLAALWNIGGLSDRGRRSAFLATGKLVPSDQPPIQ